MRADIADRPKGPTSFRLEAPVPVAVEEQPVLEIATGHEANLAQTTRDDQFVGMLVERVIADVEVRGVDHAAIGRELDQCRRLAGRHRQRLLADEVPAGGQDLRRLDDVEIVRRGDVDDIDGRIGQQVIERRIRARHTERLCPGSATFRCAAEHAPNRDADPSEGLDMDRPDKSGPDDGRADLGQPVAGSHPTNGTWGGRDVGAIR